MSAVGKARSNDKSFEAFQMEFNSRIEGLISQNTNIDHAQFFTTAEPSTNFQQLYFNVSGDIITGTVGYSASIVEIATGAIDIGRTSGKYASHVIVQAETSTTDTLTDINNFVLAYQDITIQADTGDTITVNETGNIVLPTGTTTLDLGPGDQLRLRYDIRTNKWTAFFGAGSGGGGGGANTALSNLASVAINTSLLPGADNSINLGSSGLQWDNIFLAGNIFFGTSGAQLASDTTIWADGDGDMVLNVPDTKSIFFQQNGVVMAEMIEDSLEVITTTTNGPDLKLNNNDLGIVNGNTVAQIFFVANNDLGVNANYGAIEFDADNIGNASKQGQFKVSCQRNNALALVIDYTGSDGIFKFSSGVDVVRANSQGDVELGSTGQFWDDVFSETFTLRGSGGNTSGGRTIYANSNDMIFNVPTGDGFLWQFNNDFDITLELTSSSLTMKNDSTTSPNFFTMLRNDPSPVNGDEIAVFSFSGTDSTAASTRYGQIKCFAEDVVNGSEDGSLDFLVLGGGAVGSPLQSGIKIEGDTSTTVKLGFFGVTPVDHRGPWIITNFSVDRTFNASSVTLADLGQIVASIVNDLGNLGLFEANVTA